MGEIRIILPPWSPYALGPAVLHDMAAGHAYWLFWLTEDFGAGMGVIDMTKGLLHV